MSLAAAHAAAAGISAHPLFLEDPEVRERLDHLRRLEDAMMREFRQAEAQTQANHRTWTAWQQSVRVAVLAGEDPPPRPAMPEPQRYSINYAAETARLRDELARIGRRVSARVLPDLERELADAHGAVRPQVAAVHAAVPGLDRLTALVDVCRRATGEAVEHRRPVTAGDLGGPVDARPGLA